MREPASVPGRSHNFSRRATSSILAPVEGKNVTDTSLCCEPIINLWGAYWPAWVPCLVCGILLTLVSRLVFSWTRLEPHLGPLLLVYPMLIVAYACGLWLLLYRA
jgi:hypothetical protein